MYITVSETGGVSKITGNMKSIKKRITIKELIILIGIVLIDLITKLSASHYLPFKENVSIIGDRVSFYLIHNEESMGSHTKILIGYIQSVFPNINISDSVTSVVLRVVTLIICGVFFCLSKSKWVRLSFLLILAGGAGNLISFFYPPFRVIDFISIKGSYELVRIGVFNLADLVFYIGLIGLIISALVEEVQKKVLLKNEKK
jgi:lipoprotein signal peptidase